MSWTVIFFLVLYYVVVLGDLDMTLRRGGVADKLIVMSGLPIYAPNGAFWLRIIKASRMVILLHSTPCWRRQGLSRSHLHKRNVEPCHAEHIP